MAETAAGCKTAGLVQVREAAAQERVGATEQLVSSVLRYGGLASLLVVASGIVLLLAEGRTGYTETFDLAKLLAYDGSAAVAWPRAIGGVISGALAGQPYALILLGLLLLIATPVVRVVISIFAFLLERDHTYVAITLFVLAVLLLSFFLGAAEGHA